MNKKLTILLLVLVILVVAGLSALYYFMIIRPVQQPAVIAPLNLNLLNSNSNINSAPNLNIPVITPPVISNTPVINTNSSAPDYQPASISISNFAFHPQQLTVKIGTTVTWTNDDPAPHQIGGSILDSQLLNTGDSYNYIFTQAGTYDYHCLIHPTMTGQIIVQ